MLNAAESERAASTCRGTAARAWRIALCWMLLATSTRAEFPGVRVSWKDGDSANGKLLPCDKPGRVRLQCPAFTEPLEFDVQNCLIEPREPVDRSRISGLMFRLSNGTALGGKIAGLDEAHITIDTPKLGQIRVPRSQLREFVRNNTGRPIFVGLRSAHGWDKLAENSGWKYVGNSLVSKESGARVGGDVDLPEKSEIRLALSWSKTPHFSLALDSTVMSMVSFEVVGDKLMMIIEGPQSADMAPIPGALNATRRLDLVVFLDRSRGIVIACSPNGRVLAKLELPGYRAAPRTHIDLRNHKHKSSTGELCLERFEVHSWNGRLPLELPEAQDVIDVGEESELYGKMIELNADLSEVSFIDENEKTSKIPLESIQRAVFSPSGAALQSSEMAVSVELSDGLQLVGTWKGMNDEKVEFQIAGIDDPVHFALQDVVGITGNFIEEEPAKSNAVGRLRTETATVTGRFADSEGDGVLRWQPNRAAGAVQLAQGSRGKIEYDLSAAQPEKRPVSTALNRAVMAQGLRIVNGRAVKAQPEVSVRKSLYLGLKLRRGDEIEGKVARIDEHGVTFSSNETTTTFLPNDQMDSVVLSTSRVVLPESPAKLKRLMTVPRLSKNDPPTHLLISVNGDYLRGRLVELDGARVVMEVRLENITLPLDQIAEIHWLYRREWHDEKMNQEETTEQVANNTGEPADQSPLQIQAVMRRTGRSFTFLPNAFANDTFRGHSDLLGDCNIEVTKVSTIIFGPRLNEQLREPSADAWKLSLAPMPKVYEESESGQAQNLSPLVGEPAPDFSLTTSDGGKFRLSEHRGRVLVVDFWASWCGPCLQTMPEVERIVKEVGDDQVDIVAINLQETQQRAMATLKRLELSPTTLVLDTDGRVAQQYQATTIPQTVIIDRLGNVTHLFVGGGRRMLDDFSEALSGVVNDK